MAAVALTTANRVEVIESIDQKTLLCGEAITAGQAVRQSSAGKWVKADAAAGSNANGKGCFVALRTAALGEALTAMRQGRLDGYALSGLAYGADVFLSDTAGTIQTTAGTTSVVLGRVEAAIAQPLGTSPDKVLRVDCPL